MRAPSGNDTERPVEPEQRPDRLKGPVPLRDRFAVFAAWLSLVSYILAIGHYSFVEHASCAEHGELVHAGHDHAGHDHADHDQHGGHDHEAEPSSSLQDEAAGPQSSFVARSEGSHEHDHCLVCADRREVVLSCFAVPAFAPRDVPEEITFERPASLDVVRDIYAFAPKTSPPRVSA